MELSYETLTHNVFMKLVEEVGEVAQELNKETGRKTQDHASSLTDELVDVIPYTLAIASINGIAIDEKLIDKDIEASININNHLILKNI